MSYCELNRLWTDMLVTNTAKIYRLQFVRLMYNPYTCIWNRRTHFDRNQSMNTRLHTLPEFMKIHQKRYKFIVFFISKYLSLITPFAKIMINRIDKLWQNHLFCRSIQEVYARMTNTKIRICKILKKQQLKIIHSTSSGSDLHIDCAFPCSHDMHASTRKHFWEG